MLGGAGLLGLLAGDVAVFSAYQLDAHLVILRAALVEGQAVRTGQRRFQPSARRLQAVAASNMACWFCLVSMCSSVLGASIVSQPLTALNYLCSSLVSGAT